MAQVLVLLQARLSEVEGENARLKSMLKQKDEEVEGIDKVAKRLQDERGKVADIIRQEFADRFVLIIIIIIYFLKFLLKKLHNVFNGDFVACNPTFLNS